MENFEACWHSYHLECLTDSSVCPICRVGVENAIRSFSLHANRSVNPSRNRQATMMKISLTENRD